MSDQNLDQMRAERDRLSRQIQAAEAQAVVDHNSAVSNLEAALTEFAEADGWALTSGRRKNAALLDLGFPDRVVSVALYFDEDNYLSGSTKVSVTDRASNVTASFDGLPTSNALISLVKGWLFDDSATEK